jgi:tRNA threonylcarbamoyladenosine biosynthesis protein TsaB
LAAHREGDYNPPVMNEVVSIAIETSCRTGGIALGVGDRLAEHVAFDASRRHAAQLVSELSQLLSRASLAPTDLNQLYVSVGPGSFTGVRVGVTVARTLAQFLDALAVVAVPTVQAVAENMHHQEWDHLGVVLDAGNGLIHAATFSRRGAAIAPDAPGATHPARRFVEQAPKPILLTGEGLWYHECMGPQVKLADEAVRLPTAEGVWRVGRRLAEAEQFTPIEQLLPIYATPPAAERA